MKSILIISPWLGIKNRGAETFAKELSEQLAKKYHITLVLGKEVQLNNVHEQIALNFKPSMLVKAFEKVYFCVVVLSKRKFFGFLFNFIRRVWDRIYYIHPEVLYQKEFVIKLNKEVPKRKWDIIFPQNGIQGVKWALRRKSKGKALSVIYTGHGGIGKAESLILKTDLDQYVAITDESFKWAKRINERVIHIYNGVNVGMFDGVNVHKKKNDVINVISVGALTDFKRHHLTIQALVFIPNAFLRIIGDGELRSELVKLADKMIPGRYEIEKVQYNDMKIIYSDADVFVLPSLNEPMGIVYIEALVSGLKVVAPNDAVRREILQEFGFYTNVENPKLYAEAILSAYSSEYPSFEAIKYAKNKFSWSSISNQYSNIFERLVG